MNMRPDIYLRLIFIMMGRETFVTSFSILSDTELLTNIGAQALGYAFGVVTNRPFEASKLWPPIISYGSQAYDFVTQVTGPTRAERVATLAFILSGTGLLSKTGDSTVNIGAGSFLFLLGEYIETITKSAGGGNVPFIMVRPNRSLRRFTNKQHFQCQLAITGIIIITVGCSYILILITKKVMLITKKLLNLLKLNYKTLYENLLRLKRKQ